MVSRVLFAASLLCVAYGEDQAEILTPPATAVASNANQAQQTASDMLKNKLEDDQFVNEVVSKMVDKLFEHIVGVRQIHDDQPLGNQQPSDKSNDRNEKWRGKLGAAMAQLPVILAEAAEMTQERKVLSHLEAAMSDSDDKYKVALHRGWQRHPSKVIEYLQKTLPDVDEDKVHLNAQPADNSNFTVLALLGVGCASVVSVLQILYTKSKSAEVRGYSLMVA